MTNIYRRTVLSDRHAALGSKLENWNGMGCAWTYEQDISVYHEAIRTKAGLMDVSGLKKVHVVGPHAEALINDVTTRDVTKLYPGKSVYAAMLNESGHFIDDCVIFRNGPSAFLVVHGGGQGYEALTRAALGRNVAVLFDDDLHDLSLQGPVAVDFLAAHVPGIRDLNYFHHMHTTLFGRPVTISRTGYTGERGYEIFCRALDAHHVWDNIVEKGAAMGIIPCAFLTLDWLRVESSLVFYPYDNSEMYPFADAPAGDSLWELGLDFTVSPGKTDFRGANEHYRLQGKERFRIFGVLLEGDIASEGGDTLWADDRQVGVITCGMYSALTKKSMAIARLEVPYAVHGQKLDVRGKGGTTRAISHTMPFDDPQKIKRIAKG